MVAETGWPETGRKVADAGAGVRHGVDDDDT